MSLRLDLLVENLSTTIDCDFRIVADLIAIELDRRMLTVTTNGEPSCHESGDGNDAKKKQISHDGPSVGLVSIVVEMNRS